MRHLFTGLWIGAALSGLRLLPGLDLLQVPLLDPVLAYRGRGLALLLVGLTLLLVRGRRATSPRAWLAGLTLGYALVGLFLQPRLQLESLTGLAAAGAVAFVIALALERVTEKPKLEAVAALEDDVAAGAPSEAASTRAPLVSLLGIGLLGGGVALAMEGPWRHLRSFGTNALQDRTVGALVWIALALAGAVLLGAPLLQQRSSRGRGFGLAFFGIGAAAACLASMETLKVLADPRGLPAYLDRYGLDTSEIGRGTYTAAIAATIFVAPALFAGAAAVGFRRRVEAGVALIGAGLGTALVPALFDAGVPHSAALISIGIWTASAGAVTALIGGPVARWQAGLGLLLAIGASVLTALRPPEPVRVMDPWDMVIPNVLVSLETRTGFLTVESTRGGIAATLDRRRLTPYPGTIEADLQSLEDSVLRVPGPRGEAVQRMLFVGQLTHDRSLALRSAGAQRIDRTAPWWPSMARLEESLFGPMDLPPGEVISTDEARARIDAGSYDLIVAVSTPGEAPLAALPRPEGVTSVVWFDLGSGCASRTLTPRAVLASDGLEHPLLGSFHGDQRDDADIEVPDAFDTGSPNRSLVPLRSLLLREHDRAFLHTRLAAARIARANSQESTPAGALWSGLSGHYAAQIYSNPMETTAQQTELDPAAMADLVAAASTAPIDVTIRRAVEGLTEVLRGKRDVEAAYELFEPLAERHPEWALPARILAYADLEALAPEEARDRLLPHASPGQLDPRIWLDLAEAHSQAGSPSEAVAARLRAAELEPLPYWAARDQLVDRVRAGEPDLVPDLQAFATEHPEDPTIQGLLEGGPPPPTRSGYPVEALHEGHVH